MCVCARVHACVCMCVHVCAANTHACVYGVYVHTCKCVHGGVYACHSGCLARRDIRECLKLDQEHSQCHAHYKVCQHMHIHMISACVSLRHTYMLDYIKPHV